MKSLIAVLALGLMFSGCPAAADAPTVSVTTYHNSSDRSGRSLIPGLTWDRARRVHLDPSFRTQITGHIYAEPLYWRPPGSGAGLLIVATEDDIVFALDAATGATRWRAVLGSPVPRSSLSCGNIDPLGITGTPVINERSQTLYVDAVVGQRDGPQHMVFGLSLRDGSVLPGFPLNVSEVLRAKGLHFNARDQNERGALIIAGGRVYVPYGGHFGDCGDYHGAVVGISLDDPKDVIGWETRGAGGGIWAPGGISFADQSLFVATGNTLNAKGWADGEAIIRLSLDLKTSDRPMDYFAPRNWRELDGQDSDLGGTNPLPLNVPSSGGTVPLLLALGKDGKAYLVDRRNLGGIGGALVEVMVSSRPIRTSPAAFLSGDGMLVALAGDGVSCPNKADNSGLIVLKVNAAPRPGIATAWCGSVQGAGAPIVTTSDESGADPIVWIVGAEGDHRLHGFRGNTGEPLTSPGERLEGLRHFTTILAANDHLYVADDARIYAFGF